MSGFLYSIALQLKLFLEYLVSVLFPLCFTSPRTV